jgi:hypothetical protein
MRNVLSLTFSPALVMVCRSPVTHRVSPGLGSLCPRGGAVIRPRDRHVNTKVEKTNSFRRTASRAWSYGRISPRFSTSCCPARVIQNVVAAS